MFGPLDPKRDMIHAILLASFLGLDIFKVEADGRKNTAARRCCRRQETSILHPSPFLYTLSSLKLLYLKVLKS